MSTSHFFFISHTDPAYPKGEWLDKIRRQAQDIRYPGEPTQPEGFRAQVNSPGGEYSSRHKDMLKMETKLRQSTCTLVHTFNAASLYVGRISSNTSSKFYIVGGRDFPTPSIGYSASYTRHYMKSTLHPSRSCLQGT
ncbi:hypothetical protein AVEN_211097-1 [Araneus ventricosus]|uniref:Uncharacterized protein n=1 Tax=Araneus ventricosus TaxID=182803 RepID=A0A4Y2GS04_ARAVE|nr:hypothetical protein AVEN_211097-1 [Araneus ventricosus]